MMIQGVFLFCLITFLVVVTTQGNKTEAPDLIEIIDTSEYPSDEHVKVENEYLKKLQTFIRDHKQPITPMDDYPEFVKINPDGTEIDQIQQKSKTVKPDPFEIVDKSNFSTFEDVERKYMKKIDDIMADQRRPKKHMADYPEFVKITPENSDGTLIDQIQQTTDTDDYPEFVQETLKKSDGTSSDHPQTTDTDDCLTDDYSEEEGYGTKISQAKKLKKTETQTMAPDLIEITDTGDYPTDDDLEFEKRHPKKVEGTSTNQRRPGFHSGFDISSLKTLENWEPEDLLKIPQSSSSSSVKSLRKRTGTSLDQRRPVWNIAHMVNAIYEIDGYLNSGANSIEFDVTFKPNGEARYTYHGIPCDCFRSCMRYQDFVTYISHLRHLTTPGDSMFKERLVLLFMDLKLNSLNRHNNSYEAGLNIGQTLVKHYWENGTSGARAYIVFSMPSIKQIYFVRGFKDALKNAGLSHYEDKIGYDFSENEGLDEIRLALKNEDIHDHIWQGDGITNCLPRSANRLKECLRRRDNGTGPNYVDKVYWWTVDKESTIKRTLSLGVDGLITNFPARFMTVLRDPVLKEVVRLATFEDNPFSRHPPSALESLMLEDLQRATFDIPDEILYNS